MQDDYELDIDVQADEINDIISRIERMPSDELLSDSTFALIMSVDGDHERNKIEKKAENHARMLKVFNDFKSLYKSFKMSLAEQRGTSRGRKTAFIDQPITLNCGDWICDNSGVRKNEFNKTTADFTVKYASPIPVTVSEILKNTDTEVEKIKLDFFKDGWRNVICNRSTTASNTKIIDLADKGLEVNSDNAKLLVKYIADLVSYNLDVIPRYPAISRLGWIDNDFMPYNANIRFDGEKENRTLFDAVRQKGDYGEWKKYVSELRKNIYFRLQLSTSFAAPLVAKCHSNSFILHFWGGTGTGKTVGMAAAMSVWGNPAKGKMWRALNNTINYIMNLSAFFHNLPVGLDELQLIKNTGGTYDKLIYSLTEGAERGRMSYDTAKEVRTWETAFIFTGEEPLIKSNSGGGAANRVIELECTGKTVIEKDGNTVMRFIADNYGLAGMEYIDAIRNEDIHTQYKALFDEIMEKCDTTEKQASSMALIMLGDKLSSKYIFGDKDDVLTVGQVSRFLISAKDVDVTERAYECVLGLVAANANKFVDTGTGEIWGRIDGDEYVYINKNILMREMSNAGFEFDAVKSKWADKGYLVRNTAGKLLHQTRCFGIKTAYIKIKLRETGSDEFTPLDKDTDLPF